MLECDLDKSKVLYIDYGNEEWIGDDRLAPVAEQFCQLPEVCMRCNLDLSAVSGAWSEGSSDKLLELYGEQELRCKVTSKTGDGVLGGVYM